MRAMNETFLPDCCSPLNDDWPFSMGLPGAELISTAFDPARLSDSDFARAGIVPVSGVAKRQSEHLAGRLCAREALRRVTGQATTPGVGEDRAPQWPAGTCGSITHSHNRAAAIVAPTRQWRSLGIDLERMMPPQRAERLAAEILTPQELQRIAHLDPEQRAWQISLTFSLKESLFKALYPLVLKRFYFQDAELLWIDPEQRRARLRLLLDLDDAYRAGCELPALYAEWDDRLLSLVPVEQTAESAD